MTIPKVSLQQLKETLKQSPNILPDDFDIDLSTLELRVNASNLNNNNGANNSGSDLENAFDYDSRTMPSKFSLQKYINESCEGVHQEPDYVNISLQVSASCSQFVITSMPNSIHSFQGLRVSQGHLRTSPWPLCADRRAVQARWPEFGLQGGGRHRHSARHLHTRDPRQRHRRQVSIT